MTADSMHASHREHRAGRSATSGAGGHELPWRSSTAPNLAASTCSPFISQIRSGTLPSASVGERNPEGCSSKGFAGPTALLPEMVGRKFREILTACRITGFEVGGHRDGNPSTEPVIRADTRVGLKFLAARQPGSNTRRDSTDGHPRGPFVGSDPPWLFLSHALKHRSGNVPDQRNVFTFAEIQDGRRT